jgi:hypothetical protein
VGAPWQPGRPGGLVRAGLAVSTDVLGMPFAASVQKARDKARRLEAENPLWIVVFGVYSEEFVCFPRFRVQGCAIVAARNPDALPPRMRRVESSAVCRDRAESRMTEYAYIC